jgi:hypothetical protein
LRPNAFGWRRDKSAITSSARPSIASEEASSASWNSL